MDVKYSQICRHYENCFEKYGATHKGVDWPSEDQMLLRYNELLKIVKSTPCTLLDFGCGLAGLRGVCNENIKYFGLDISRKFIDYCESKYKDNRFFCIDVLKTPLDMKFDYIIMNGVLTAKFSLTHEEMMDYAKQLIKKCFSMCNKGLAVNFTSPFATKHKDKLFCPHFSEIIEAEVSTNFVVKHDYLSYEYAIFFNKQMD